MDDTRCAFARKSDHGTSSSAISFSAKPGCVFCCPKGRQGVVFGETAVGPREKGEEKMPRNQFQRSVFALLTVIITVHAYVFFSLYVIHGGMFMEMTGQSTVLAAIDAMGGVMLCGRMVPIWLLVLVEFVLAFGLESVYGSPLSFKLACRNFDPRTTHPVLFETAIICTTVGLMCPAMSFIAAFLYYPYYTGFDLLTLLANWLELMCYNFPFAFFTQLFFIQPAVRTLFKLIFSKDLARRAAAHAS